MNIAREIPKNCIKFIQEQTIEIIDIWKNLSTELKNIGSY